jgi:hypothetical protein
MVIEMASKSMRGPEQNLEFLAKRLSLGVDAQGLMGSDFPLSADKDAECCLQPRSTSLWRIEKAPSPNPARRVSGRALASGPHTPSAEQWILAKFGSNKDMCNLQVMLILLVKLPGRRARGIAILQSAIVMMR